MGMLVCSDLLLVQVLWEYDCPFSRWEEALQPQGIQGSVLGRNQLFNLSRLQKDGQAGDHMLCM